MRFEHNAPAGNSLQHRRPYSNSEVATKPITGPFPGFDDFQTNYDLSQNAHYQDDRKKKSCEFYPLDFYYDHRSDCQLDLAKHLRPYISRGALHDSMAPMCLPNTREKVLKIIMDCSRDSVSYG